MEDQKNTQEDIPQKSPDIQTEKKSSTGLDEHVAGALCYVFGFITGIIFMLMEKESKYVRFHALQSIFLWAGLLVISIVLGMIPILGWLVSLLLTPVGLVIWIICIIKAYQGKWLNVPFVGKIAQEQAEKM